ncbi:ABC transporter substrate-binding protein [Streptomyces sp. NPDC059009]|uniref:ABC transporter substrate-binding protein n=1 Tax=Streptomyces sp. NPDC059009 TaxID=3346694 RepID=UPI003687A052
MTEFFHTVVNEAHGSVNTGEGPQINIHLAAARSRVRDQTERRTLTISEEDRNRLYQRFIDPPRMEQARRVLARTRTVLVGGLPGNGRRATALMLLHTLPGARGSLHELPDTADDDSASPLDAQEINQGDRLLLDLSESDESRYLSTQERLFDFRDRLLQRDAHLVIVLPHRLGYLLRDELRHLTVEIGRPSPRQVFVRHLRCDDIAPTPAELSDSELTGYLTHAPVRQVAALADRIRRRRDAAGAEHGFAHWLADSLAEVHDQATRVAADIAAAEDGRRRALLLSLAMFHGCAPGTVLNATNELLRALSHPQDETPRLDRTDLHAEFTAIGAETQQHGHIRFQVPGYDTAVRNHFWTYLPDIRRQLRDWFKTCMGDSGLGQSEREGAVTRFAEQVLRSNRPEDLRWLVDEWTRGSASAHLVPDAAQALALGLADDQHGRYFRQQIYDWSTTSDTANALQHVLVLVCSEAMARTHPDQALVRLHHLARRASGRVGATARDALLQLARSDNRLYQLLLDRLSTGVSQGQWAAKDAVLFLVFADPIRLIRSSSTRACLVVGWTAALQHPEEQWGRHAVSWFNACLADTDHRGSVLDVLASACGSDSRVSGRLFRIARHWQRTGAESRGEHANVVSLLLRAIDTRQGVTTFPAAS